MTFYLSAKVPMLEIGEEVEADNAFRAVEVVRLLVKAFDFIVLLDKQEPTHCRGKIFRDNGLELLPVGTVTAVAVN